jgi:hypothetical protein
VAGVLYVLLNMSGLTSIIIICIAWFIALLETFLFRSYMRKNYPQVGLFIQGGIKQQFAFNRWIWSSAYKAIGNAAVTRRVLIHRIISSCVIIAVGICVVDAILSD